MIIETALEIVAEEIRNATDKKYLRKCAEAAAELIMLLIINE